MGCNCVKRLALKGFACWQAQSENLFSFVERFLLAIYSRRANVLSLLVATPNQTKLT